MKKLSLLLVLLFTAFNLDAQIKVVKIEKAGLPESITGYQLKFAPDGKSIYFSNSNYDGIWRYSITDRKITEITKDRFSGYSFDFDESGTRVTYRRSLVGNGKRIQEIVEKNIIGNTVTVIDRGEDLSTPLYSGGNIVYSKNRALLNLNSYVKNDEIKIIGIENTKISILKNGKKELLDPVPGGSYIWPSLSPDGKMIVAYEMSKGTFVCSADGKIISFLGRKDAPSFTKDGKWIVYMNDKDDGNNIITSDIYCTSIDGKQTVRLTNSADVIELNPVCSAKENKIAFSSLNGDIFILSYEESK